jgi:uncharacterized protein (TIGR02246 family)
MGGPTDADARTQDEREIRALIDRMFDAWGRGDAVAYHADLTDDADYVAFDGSRRSKADSIRSHQNLFRTVLYGSRLTGQVESIRFVTPDVAVVHPERAVPQARASTNPGMLLCLVKPRRLALEGW